MASGSEPQLPHQVVAVEGEGLGGEGVAGLQDACGALAELLDALQLLRGGAPLAEDVGAAEHVEVFHTFAGDAADPAADGGVGPGWLVADEVVADEVDDAEAVVVGEAEALEDGVGDLGADALVLVEGVVAGLVAEGAALGLADVVEEGGDAEDGVALAGVEAGHGVAPDVEDVPAILLAAVGGDELGAGDVEDAGAEHDVEGAAGLACLHGLDPLVVDAFGADLAEGVEGQVDGGLGVRVEGGLQRGDEASGAEHPEPILGEALGRLADGADDPLLEVAEAAEGVDEGVGVEVEGDGVDGEVAAGQVLGDLGEVAYLVGAASVGVGALAPEGGHLVGVAVEEHGDGAVVDPGGDDPGEEALHLLGERVGAHVVVSDLLAPEQVTDGAPHHPGLLAGAAEPPAQLVDRRRDGGGDLGGGRDLHRAGS